VHTLPCGLPFVRLLWAQIGEAHGKDSNPFSTAVGLDEGWIWCELARMPVAVHTRHTCVVGVALGI